MFDTLDVRAHKSALGLRGDKTSADAIICSPLSVCTGLAVTTDARGAAARATTLRFDFSDFTASPAEVPCVLDATTGCTRFEGALVDFSVTSSPNAARAETPPAARFTTGKRAAADAGNTINSDITEIAI